jgi:hypothetical protein
MATSKFTMTLTDDQQRKIREATGQTVTELTIEASATDDLSDQQLDAAAGGTTRPTGKSPMVYLRYTMTNVT